MFLKLFYKIEKEGMLPDSLYKASIALIPMPDKRTTRKKHTHKYSQQNTGKQICEVFIFLNVA